MGFVARQKISHRKNWSYMETLYHIYAGNRCLYPNIKEEDFTTTWNTVKGMVGLLETDYTVDDLSYEVVTINRQLMQEASY